MDQFINIILKELIYIMSILKSDLNMELFFIYINEWSK